MGKEKFRNFYRWSTTDIKQMIDLYESGLTLEQVGERFGISKQRIALIFKKAGVQKRRFTKSKKFITGHKRRQRIIPKEKLIELYIEKELPVNEIIKKLKTNAKIFYRSLDFHRIPRRKDKGIGNSPLKREDLHRLYIEEDLTATEIARRFNCAAITVRKRLSLFGIRKGDRKKIKLNRL